MNAHHIGGEISEERRAATETRVRTLKHVPAGLSRDLYLDAKWLRRVDDEDFQAAVASNESAGLRTHDPAAAGEQGARESKI